MESGTEERKRANVKKEEVERKGGAAEDRKGEKGGK